MSHSDTKYTWVKTHKQLVEYIKGKRENQKELIELLDKAGVDKLIDEDPKDNRIPLGEIDPLSFFCFIHKHGDNRRIAVLQHLAEELNLHVPTDVTGVPTVQPLKVMMFPFKHHRNNDEINKLWDFFFAALNDEITDEQFADIIDLYGVGKVKITEALYFIDPDKYFPVNGPAKPYLSEELGIDPNFDTYNEYRQIVKQVKEKTNRAFYEVSYDAYLWNEEQKKTGYWVFQCNPSNFDVVEALQNDELRDWSVDAHVDKIKKGDKVILWVTGSASGCYALCKVASDVYEDDKKLAHKGSADGDTHHRVDLSVTHNLVSNPITKEQVAKIPELSDMNVGYQGTNFNATKKEYESLLELAERISVTKWNELAATVNRIHNESAVRKFFNSARYVLDKLNIQDDAAIIYSSAIDKKIQLTIGNRYVVQVKGKKDNVELGFYVKNEFVEELSEKYPDLIQKESDEKEGSGRSWLIVSAGEVDEKDFFDGILALAHEGFNGQSKSQFRSQYKDKHNYWIIRAALDEEVLNRLFVKHYLVGAYWNDEVDMTDEFIKEEKWVNGYDDKFIDEVATVPEGSRIAIKSVYTRNKTDSVMAIKARGVVAENYEDGKNLKVDWEAGFKSFEVGFSGGYWSTISEVKNGDHIARIWYDRSDEKTIPIKARVIYAYLLKALSHRDIQKKILEKEAPKKGGGFLAMEILHEFDIKGDKKGILKTSSFDIEYKRAEGDYLQALNLLKEHYEEFSIQSEKTMEINYPLNTILYGPPGTGKTYNTIKRAAEIVEGRKIDNYGEAQEIFNENLGDTIEFITFHQNYSYEDFIQGLRPDIENNQDLTFQRQDGLFKKLADRARKNQEKVQNPHLKKKPFDKVFKEFITPLVEEEVEEIEVEMTRVSYFITGLNPKGNGLEFRKASGGTAHNLNIHTLEKMYEAESTLEIQGMSIYYQPLLDRLLELGKSDTEKENTQKKNYVIVIDEINRANISRVFGELITLIEPDKRAGGEIPLSAKLSSGERFTVPSNLYIIGTMNTADKSVALLDIALRRRFEFEAMYPKYEINGEELPDADVLKKINKRIVELKGHDFQIGHSYFMDESSLKKRMNTKVIPLLLEYFMNDKDEVKGILSHAGLKVKEDVWPLQIAGRA